MTRKIYTDEHDDYDTSMYFGGIICESDFYTNYCSGGMAKRIASDSAFNKMCMQNLITRDKRRQQENEQINKTKNVEKGGVA